MGVSRKSWLVKVGGLRPSGFLNYGTLTAMSGLAVLFIQPLHAEWNNCTARLVCNPEEYEVALS
jgi:hypothetical protein